MSSYADSASEDLGRPPGVSPAPDDDRVLIFLFSTADAIEQKPENVGDLTFRLRAQRVSFTPFA
jgi:hypothetical protein